MAASVEETLISVWRQTLAENSPTVTLENRTHPVRRTSRSKLREVDFEFWKAENVDAGAFLRDRNQGGK